MSEENYKVQWSVSLPPAAQYAKGDMLNVRGESIQEVEAIFDAALNSSFIDKAAQVAALVRAAAVVTDADLTPQDAAPQQQYQQPVQQQTQYQPQTKQAPQNEPAPLYTCVHGKRTEYHGTNSRGAYTAYFCPLKKGDPNQCEPVWG